MAGAVKASGALVVLPAREAAGGASRWLTLPPPRLAWALTLIALMAHVAIWGFAAPYGRSIAGGVGVEVLGLAWMLWAAWQFRRADTTIRPTGTPRVLVDEGPFRLGRNPMYLGITLALLGLGLKLGAPFMAVAALAFAAVVHRVHIPHEEAQLQRAFGGWYSDYAATVRRWL